MYFGDSPPHPPNFFLTSSSHRQMVSFFCRVDVLLPPANRDELVSVLIRPPCLLHYNHLLPVSCLISRLSAFLILPFLRHLPDPPPSSYPSLTTVISPTNHDHDLVFFLTHHRLYGFPPPTTASSHRRLSHPEIHDEEGMCSRSESSRGSSSPLTVFFNGKNDNFILLLGISCHRIWRKSCVSFDPCISDAGVFTHFVELLNPSNGSRRSSLSISRPCLNQELEVAQ